MKAYMVIDGQWGSSGKGSLAGKLAIDRNPDAVVCNFGPNAGHTFVYPDDTAVMTQQLPTGCINPDTELFIGPGSMINPDLLFEEMARLAHLGIEDRLHIHPRASVVLPVDKEREALSLVAIASTRKGTGSSLARKISRANEGYARIAAEDYRLQPFVLGVEEYDRRLQSHGLVQIESAQGLELSLNRGCAYPYCTSRDITPEQVLADVAIPHRFLDEVCAVLRTFPIRVGNEYNENGQEVGNSGPVYPDMEELTWDSLSDQLVALGGTAVLERTTVTKKVRRIFTFSKAQFERMLHVVSPNTLFVNYVNYLDPTAKKLDDLNIMTRAFLHELSEQAGPHGARVGWLGFGPAYHEVETVSYGAL